MGLGRQGELCDHPEERRLGGLEGGPGHGVVTWSWSLNGFEGKEDILASAWTTLFGPSLKRNVYLDFTCTCPLSQSSGQVLAKWTVVVLSSYISFVHLYHLSLV